ncbi:helix-turn-helix transcriptional regulator [Synoicihabitans lomoniglobus]|uniref:LuxR C-terminal-related transcriptional regulator n=1 Tax=Synoicihabitans lomoniglobus TaxID=2909285 RepID=A0AAF0CIM3_9BACT|nr:LuxR C-terminal-related transcriptional regulator [Opitutaceae bacterium LMO-M01]WED65567.1 LuxR C-terminal-related transcriptional regulator [Opitutaceae bacterium LMO-M01]
MISDPSAKIHELWDELADLPLAETRLSIELLFSRISEWVGADDAFWIGIARVQSEPHAANDVLHGWRLRTAERWITRPEYNAEFIRKVLAHMERDPGMGVRKVISEAGRFRSYRQRDGFIDFKAFRQTPQYEMYFKKGGITDRIWCVSPVNRDAESLFCFDRIRRRSHFTLEHERLVAQVLRGIKWFHRQLLLNHGLLVGKTPLSPTHRRLLPQLLSSKSEKEIADALGLSRATTHKYVTDIFRSFNVSSRAGLMTLWMGGT